MARSHYSRCLAFSQPALGLDSVHIWRANLSAENGLENLLAADERDRAARFLFPQHRRRFAACRGLLRHLLSGYVDAPPQEIRFGYGEHGRPFLAQPAGRGVCFSVSHSEDAALLAFARTPIGIDIERIRDVDVESLAASVFSERERRHVTELEGSRRLHAFFECWTRKEACVKAESRGLSVPLQQFIAFPFPAGENAWNEIEITSPGVISRWQVASLDAGTGFCAAIAAQKPLCRVLLQLGA